MPKLFLNGIVGDEINANQVREYLDSEKSDEITVVINSPGGNVFEGLEVYNLLRASGKRITTVLSGLAASMGSVIFLAGDERIAMDGTLFMIHKPSTFSWGDADDLKKDAEMLDKVQEGVDNIYKERTSIKDVTELVNDTTWFTVEEMKESGITNSEKKVVLFDNDNKQSIDSEGETQTEGAEDMAKIDDLKAELEAQKKINAELEEKAAEAELEKEIAAMKAKNEQLANSSEDPKTVEDDEPEDNDEPDEVEPEDEELPEDDDQEDNSDADEEPNEDDGKPTNKSKKRIIKSKNTKVVQNKNKYPAYMQGSSKY